MQIVPGSELDEQLGEGAFPKRMNAPGQVMDARYGGSCHRERSISKADSPTAQLTRKVLAPRSS